MQTVERNVDTLELWRAYKASSDEQLRNRLMERYLPIVKYNADRIGAKLPDEVDVDDLMSAGIFGLIDAIEAYDLDRGVKFAAEHAAIASVQLVAQIDHGDGGHRRRGGRMRRAAGVHDRADALR